MNSYILLRNNKESGSLSLGDLQKIGLKSSDLIWIECQSAGWRNPHEIAELKALVSEANNSSAVIENKEASATSKESLEIVSQKTVEKKLVHVELPAEPAPVKKQKEVISFKEPESIVFEKYAGLSSSVKPAIEESSAGISTKYSRPLDEIKEMYVKNMEQEGHRQKRIIEIKLPKEFKKVALYAGLVVAGAAIMFFITKTGKQAPVAQQSIGQPVSTDMAADTLAEQINISPQTEVLQENIPIEEVSSYTTEEKKSTVPVKRPAADTKMDDNGADQPITKGTIEKSKPAVNEAVPQKMAPGENISSLLSINPNNYLVGSFGGIRNLEMTLQNDSKYLLDKVIVELRYLNPEGVILKTENIHFQSVQPGGKETVTVKKSKRGVKIAYKITKIESKDISNNTAGL